MKTIITAAAAALFAATLRATTGRTTAWRRRAAGWRLRNTAGRRLDHRRFAAGDDERSREDSQAGPGPAARLVGRQLAVHLLVPLFGEY